jgi:antitoxin MazE
MHSKLQKWGNSIGVRLPIKLIRQLQLDDGSEVDIKAVKGRLVITPVRPTGYALEDLLSQVTDENLHGEMDWGSRSGREES